MPRRKRPAGQVRTAPRPGPPRDQVSAFSLQRALVGRARRARPRARDARVPCSGVAIPREPAGSASTGPLARLLSRRPSGGRVRKRAPGPGDPRRGATHAGAGRARRRGRALLRPPRSGLARNRPRGPASRQDGRPEPGRQHHHHAGGPAVLPRPGEDLRAQAERDPPVAADRADPQQGRDPRALPEQDLLRSAGLRRRRGGPGLLRQGPPGPHAGRGGHDRGAAPGPVPPEPHHGARAGGATAQLRPAPAVRAELDRPGDLPRGGPEPGRRASAGGGRRGGRAQPGRDDPGLSREPTRRGCLRGGPAGVHHGGQWLAGGCRGRPARSPRGLRRAPRVPRSRGPDGDCRGLAGLGGEARPFRSHRRPAARARPLGHGARRHHPCPGRGGGPAGMGRPVLGPSLPGRRPAGHRSPAGIRRRPARRHRPGSASRKRVAPGPAAHSGGGAGGPGPQRWRGARARRRLRLRPEPVQPRGPGAAPAGVELQALHLLRGAGARSDRRHRHRGRADLLFRRRHRQDLASGQLRQRVPRADPSARGPRSFAQHRGHQAAGTDWRGLHGRPQPAVRAGPRPTPPQPLPRARHRGRDPARARGRLRGLCQRRVPGGAPLHRPGRGQRGHRRLRHVAGPGVPRVCEPTHHAGLGCASPGHLDEHPACARPAQRLDDVLDAG